MNKDENEDKYKELQKYLSEKKNFNPPIVNSHFLNRKINQSIGYRNGILVSFY